MITVQINDSCALGSTGKICCDISSALDKERTENYILYVIGYSKRKNDIRYSERYVTKAEALKSRITGSYGFCAKGRTKKLIKHLERIKPDIVHLHNIHAHNVNLELLFSYLKSSGAKVIWTFHDCWAFTGYCTHYAAAGCDRWTKECSDCPLYRQYSWFFDKSTENFLRKKKCLEGVGLKIACPSEWMKGEVGKSFLSECECVVINNGIDLGVFRPVKGNFRQKHGVGDDVFLIMGIAYKWLEKKGLGLFISLASMLDERFKIVMVGTNEEIDTMLPDNIISVHRTSDQNELAEIYSSADILFNPTLEDTFPTVNMEAIACGTPVLTFGFGGSAEVINDRCGTVLDSTDAQSAADALKKLCESYPFDREAVAKEGKRFDKALFVEKYLNLYRNL